MGFGAGWRNLPIFGAATPKNLGNIGTFEVGNEATMEKFPLYTDKFNIGWDNTGMGRHRDQSLPGMVDSKGEKYLLSKTHALHNSDYNELLLYHKQIPSISQDKKM